MTYYKATRPDGTDFYAGTVDYARSLGSGERVSHPAPALALDAGDASTYFPVSVEPGETLIGGSWPCRLFEIEPIGDAPPTPDYPHRRAVSALRVVRELPAWQALGPNGEEVAAFIAGIPAAWAAAGDAAGAAALAAARDAAWVAARAAAWDAARAAAGDAAWAAAWAAAGAAAWDAAGAAAGAAAKSYVVRDRISSEQFDALIRPWRILIGEQQS